MLWNQLWDGPTTVFTSGGSRAFTSGVRFIAGHKYLISCNKGDSDKTGSIFVYTKTDGSNRAVLYTLTANPKIIETANYSATSDGTATNDEGNCWLYVAMGTSESITSIQIVDLTWLYGAGNEPTSVAQHEANFPGLYAFDKGSLLSAGVTEVISKAADDTTLETFNIPEDTTTMEGYGWSCPGAYNYIDFANKKFVQNVGTVDLSDLTFGYGPTVGWSATLTNVKNPADDDTVFNGISDNYTSVSRNAQATAFYGGTDAGMISVAGGKVYVGTGDISIVPSGTLYYELETPVEMDISEYLPDADIEVEAGGSLTFHNQHGDDYKIHVPVQLEYIGV